MSQSLSQKLSNYQKNVTEWLLDHVLLNRKDAEKVANELVVKLQTTLRAMKEMPDLVKIEEIQQSLYNDMLSLQQTIILNKFRSLTADPVIQQALADEANRWVENNKSTADVVNHKGLFKTTAEKPIYIVLANRYMNMVYNSLKDKAKTDFAAALKLKDDENNTRDLNNALDLYAMHLMADYENNFEQFKQTQQTTSSSLLKNPFVKNDNDPIQALMSFTNRFNAKTPANVEAVREYLNNVSVDPHKYDFSRPWTGFFLPLLHKLALVEANGNVKIPDLFPKEFDNENVRELFSDPEKGKEFLAKVAKWLGGGVVALTLAGLLFYYGREAYNNYVMKNRQKQQQHHVKLQISATNDKQLDEAWAAVLNYLDLPATTDIRRNIQGKYHVGVMDLELPTEVVNAHGLERIKNNLHTFLPKLSHGVVKKTDKNWYIVLTVKDTSTRRSSKSFKSKSRKSSTLKSKRK